MEGYPNGVLLIPYGKFEISLLLPKAEQKYKMTIYQFPMIPAYAMTPEKLQGVTLVHDMYITSLSNRSSQILYVAYSRVKFLSQLIISEELSMEYIRSFLPKVEIIKLVRELMNRIDIPEYLHNNTIEKQKFERWFDKENSYYETAMEYNNTKIRRRKK